MSRIKTIDATLIFAIIQFVLFVHFKCGWRQALIYLISVSWSLQLLISFNFMDCLFGCTYYYDPVKEAVFSTRRFSFIWPVWNNTAWPRLPNYIWTPPLCSFTTADPHQQPLLHQAFPFPVNPCLRLWRLSSRHGRENELQQKVSYLLKLIAKLKIKRTEAKLKPKLGSTKAECESDDVNMNWTGSCKTMMCGKQDRAWTWTWTGV